MRFTQAYAGATVCAPSRCVLMTGLHTGHARVRGNARGLRQALRTEDETVATVLKNAGYATGLIGKWGLGELGEAECGLPTRHGFDYFFGYLNQTHAHNYYPSHLWRNTDRVPLRNTVPNEGKNGEGVSDNKVQYSGDLFAEETLQFVREHQKELFFLYLSVTVPHANNQAKDKGMEVPDLGEYAKRDWPEPRKGHAAMITRLDTQLGQLFDLLAKLELDDNTLVIFTSDNGPHAEGGYSPEMNDSSGPLRGKKRNLTEGGIRIPFIARWPGKIPSGTTSDAICYFADILPTLADIGKGSAGKDLDGIDLTPTLLGEDTARIADRYLYWEFHERGFDQAARHGKWKAIRQGINGPIELYDLDADIGETNNVADQQPEIVADFQKYFKSARTDTPDWPIAPKKKRS